MSIVYGVIGLVVGFFLGIGASLFLLRWKMKRQVGMMQNQMEDIMDMTEGMNQSIPDIDVEEKEGEE